VLPASPTDSVWLVARHYYGPMRRLPMQHTGPTTYTATVPVGLTYPGQLHYWVVTGTAGNLLRTFPAGQPGSPGDWDFADAGHYDVPLVAATAPLPLFQADADRGHIEAQGLHPQAWVDYPTTATGNLALRLVVSPPKADQPMPPVGLAAALRTYLGPKMSGRAADLINFKELVIKAQTNQPAATQLRVLLVTKDAVAYEATVPLTTTLGEVHVPLSALQQAPLLLIPRPYPGFLPLTYSPAIRAPFRLADVEVLQLVLEGPSGLTEPLHVDIESVMMQ
jgi:hypothetical protein